MPSTSRLFHYTALVGEAELHKRFYALRVNGEWFRDTDELRAYIEELIERDTINDKNAQSLFLRITSN